MRKKQLEERILELEIQTEIYETHLLEFRCRISALEERIKKLENSSNSKKKKKVLLERRTSNGIQ